MTIFSLKHNATDARLRQRLPDEIDDQPPSKLQNLQSKETTASPMPQGGAADYANIRKGIYNYLTIGLEK